MSDTGQMRQATANFLARTQDDPDAVREPDEEVIARLHAKLHGYLAERGVETTCETIPGRFLGLGGRTANPGRNPPPWQQ